MEGSNPELQAKLAELEHELEVSFSPLYHIERGVLSSVACASVL